MESETRKWRKLYEVAAGQPDWVQAHRWGYSREVAMRTIADIRKKLRLEAGDRILEVGCGCGMVLNDLLRGDQKGFGVDFCEPLLRESERFGVNRTRVKLVAAEASRLPFADQVFDRVLCYSVFQCFPKRSDSERGLKELIRVCKPGGTILIGDVFGVVQTLQTVWRKRRWSVETARAALRLPVLTPVRWALLPFRATSSLLRRCTKRQSDQIEATLRRRHYSKRFFKKLGASRRCKVEILSQSITGRDISAMRFDVRLTKPSSQRADHVQT